MEKFPEGRRLVESGVPQAEVLEARPASVEELSLVHSSEYLAKIRQGTWTSSEAKKMGLPVDPLLFRRCALEVGGTVLAGEAALTEGLSANLGGGTHHAAQNRASGYCILNDVAVAIRSLRKQRPDLWVMVIDTDAHQGDGTHEIFCDDRRTFTYSIHVGPNFPSKKISGDMDVAVDRWTDGPRYLELLKPSLRKVLLDFEPDLVFWVAGADIHREDRFGQMGLSVTEIEERNRFVLELVLEWSIPTAIVYGGGYNRDVSLTNHLHALPVLQAAALIDRK
ncbi:MAG: histone deacetylase [Verrucomicrobiota bacterium]